MFTATGTRWTNPDDGKLYPLFKRNGDASGDLYAKIGTSYVNVSVLTRDYGGSPAAHAATVATALAAPGGIRGERPKTGLLALSPVGWAAGGALVGAVGGALVGSRLSLLLTGAVGAGLGWVAGNIVTGK